MDGFPVTETTIPGLVASANRANISWAGLQSAVCAAARAAGALERRLRKQASCADSDTSGSTAQLWWAVNEREEET
ncbi:hypothetical protein BHE74_00059443 [Ensete ventricosum]|nr:hypothetical protein BHE74_00059443 [Ensete ventricosum]